MNSRNVPARAAAAPAITPADVAHRVKERATAIGFEAVGIAAIAPLEAREHYERWVAAGRHGTMEWLATPRHRERRADPSLILRDVRSLVCVAMCHEPGRDPLRDRRLGRIARYAAGEDYHRVMRDRLGALQRWIEDELLPGARALGYADTGAILERAWAEQAGLGWIGKHSGLLNESLGSWFVLGELLVDREIEPEAPPGRERCGTCTRCIAGCPTGAIVAPYQLDARRCISYLTIELRGPIPIELRPLVGEWIFGCDVCQEVCPWNRFAPPASEARLHARGLEDWSLERFLTLDEPAFAALFAGSPIRRARRGGFLRNVCVALGNRGEPAAVPALARAVAGDPDPLVRGHAAWALGEIGRRSRAAARGAARAALERAANDGDTDVCGEVAAALVAAKGVIDIL